MRVAVFTDADFDRASSLTTALGALLRHAPPDVRPRIYTLSDLDVDEPDYLALRSPALPLPMAAGATLHVPRLRELEKRLAADGIGAIHLTTPGPAGLTARYLAYRTGLPLVGSVHTGCVPDALGHGSAHRVKLAYLKWLYGACLKVLVPSAGAVRGLTSAGWNPDRLAVWPEGVDAEAFSPARRSQRLRNEWHVSDRRLAILCVGALDRTSGLELIEPLGSLLHRQGIAHRFVVVGEGSGLADLRERCPDAVFAGRLSQRDLATVMASADVFLWPGDAARSGLVLLEAQASGLPVVMGDGAGRDHVRPDISAVVCHAHSVLGFGIRMTELLTDLGRRRAMGDAARRFAQLRTWPASLDRVYALYRGASRPGALGAPPDTRSVRAPVRAARAQR